MLGIGVWALMLVGSGAIHYYLWIRLVRDTTSRATRARRLATGAVVASALAAPGARIATPLFDPSDGGGGRWVAWPGYTLIGVLLYLLLALVVLEVPRALLVRGWRRTERESAPVRAAEPEPAVLVTSGPAPTPETPEPRSTPAATPAASDLLVGRRLFLGRAVGTLAGAAALGTVGYGMSVALGDPLIKRVPVALSKVNTRLAGLRIAVVSDIHLGPMLGRSHTERIVRMINGLQADLVTIVGDLADGTASQLGPAARPLKGLESRYGSYFVTGNHEYLYDGVEDWLDEMRDVGVRPLVNERVEIEHNGAFLDLAGVEDLAGEETGRGPDLGRALAGRDTSRPVVLLAHQPVFAEEAARHGVDLQVSGHTHGGQMFPLTAVTALSNPVSAGLGRVDDTALYVTSGAGFFGPPVRVGAPADITLLELRAPRTLSGR
ncbi:metallophosphoesterase [Streptomyces sp. ISL-100]|uniref:metallophosphoesterase n=1 Tax=Streptomyces sp. ISL-100 TaxID=2819173 RepID=UPI001BE631A7|nr:metallophosphoesterase [Streptomyces sp. ISL-100]MBT2395491.1 metallophosphoesterase [Streptomyces sp. ISL-100]